MGSIRVCGIYLAAGKSRRMGENKLTLPLGKTTIGSLAFQAALESQLNQVIVVTKQDDNMEWMNPSFLRGPLREKWTLAKCPKANLGQSYSLKCGLNSALKRNPDAFMILLADQPFLLTETIDRLIISAEKMLLRKEDVTYIAACFQGIPRPPILFFKDFLPLLLELEGDQGARQLVRENAQKGILYEFEDATSFFDIDTKEDYQKVLTHFSKHYKR